MNTIINAIAQPIGWVLSFIYGLVGNYGIAIIIFTLLVKLCLYPLYAKQIRSTAKMSQLSPKMKAIQQKYANDKQMLNVKMSEFYKEEKFNPAAGCLPLLIQMPIIFGIFALLRQPLLYLDSDMLFAVHESFLWMVDLSQPDKWILPILAGIATYLSFLTTNNKQAQTQPGMDGMMKMMKYVFPLMIVLMGRSFSAGLSLYWFFGQFIQIFFNLHLSKVRENLKKEGGKK
jgi:YidC/Oxa1 family membrane protein insertase